MGTLMLRLASPFQSWGVDSKFNHRTSGTEPSKSGVIGMISAAMGRSRDDPVDDLVALRMGVRLDQPGRIVNDYHTVRYSDKRTDVDVTNRSYISDAVFVVGLEGEMTLLESVQSAIQSPEYPLFLGRRSCPLTGKVILGIYDSDLEESLSTVGWQASEWYRRRGGPEVFLETVIEGDSGYYVNDNPVSFSQKRRMFSPRRVSRNLHGVRIINADSRSFSERPTDHDAFSAVRGD